MKKVTILVAVVTSLFFSGAASTEKPSCKSAVESFFTGVINNEVDKAYDEFLADSLIKSKEDQVNYLKQQTKLIGGLYGKILNYEFIRQQKYGDSIIRLVYVLKTERLPLTWEFYFYKATSDWKVVNINFNDQFNLLEEK